MSEPERLAMLAELERSFAAKRAEYGRATDNERLARMLELVHISQRLLVLLGRPRTAAEFHG